MSHIQSIIHLAPVGLVTSPELQISTDMMTAGVSSGHEWTSCLLVNGVLLAWMDAVQALSQAILYLRMSSHKKRKRKTTRVLLIPKWPPTLLVWYASKTNLCKY